MLVNFALEDYLKNIFSLLNFGVFKELYIGKEGLTYQFDQIETIEA